jgi:hypothetical protein
MDNLHKAIWEYFDDFYQPSAKGACYPIPFLWAEEAHADAAVYEEQKKMNEWFATFGGDPLKSEQWKVAMLARENGYVMTEPEKCWPRTTNVKVYRVR